MPFQSKQNTDYRGGGGGSFNSTQSASPRSRIMCVFSFRFIFLHARVTGFLSSRLSRFEGPAKTTTRFISPLKSEGIFGELDEKQDSRALTGRLAHQTRATSAQSDVHGYAYVLYVCTCMSAHVCECMCSAVQRLISDFFISLFISLNFWCQILIILFSSIGMSEKQN